MACMREGIVSAFVQRQRKTGKVTPLWTPVTLPAWNWVLTLKEARNLLSSSICILSTTLLNLSIPKWLVGSGFHCLRTLSFLAKPPSWGHEPLALTPSHETSHKPPQAHPGHLKAENKQRLLTKDFTVPEKLVTLEAPGSCREFRQPGPQTTSCWCSIHLHNSLAAFAVPEAQVCSSCKVHG